MSDHPFTYDRWATPDDPEFGVVRVDDLRKIEKACLGIWAIARIVGNNMCELNPRRAHSFDEWVASNLMGSVESLCDHLAKLVGDALHESPRHCGLMEDAPISPT